jgi:hypothetical protein
MFRYADEGEDMLNRIVTGVESRVHHYQPKSKRASIQWKCPGSIPAKRYKVTPSAGYVMLAVFWDLQEVLLDHVQNRGENVDTLSRTIKFCRSFGMQSAEDVQANWHEGYCFITTMPDPTQP